MGRHRQQAPQVLGDPEKPNKFWRCEVIDDFGPCGFETSGWPTQQMADQRGKEHMTEHKTGKPMRELIHFEKAVGFKREVK